MKCVSAALACALAAVASPALAQPGWYAGFTMGQSRTSRDLVENRESTITLARDFRSDFDARDRAFKVTAGYGPWRWLALEASYADLGEHRVTTGFLGGDPPLPASFALVRAVSAAGADLVLSAPVSRGAIFARAGAARMRLKASAELEGNVVFTNGDPSERRRSTVQEETVRRFGVGFEWPLAPRAWLRAEWERYLKIGKPFAVGASGTTGEADTDAFLAGFVLRFR